MAKLTREDAQRIEQEEGLATGAMSYGREMSSAEEIYLQVPPAPLLAFHVEMFGGSTALIVYEQAIKTAINTPTQHYLAGAEYATPVDALEDVKDVWSGITIARQNGLIQVIEEEVAVEFTGWGGGVNGQRWSMSVVPGSVRSMYNAPTTKMMLRPVFENWPPDYPGGTSPGKFIARVGVAQVMFVHSVLFQGASTLLQMDGRGLRRLALRLAQQKN